MKHPGPGRRLNEAGRWSDDRPRRFILSGRAALLTRTGLAASIVNKIDPVQWPVWQLTLESMRRDVDDAT